MTTKCDFVKTLLKEKIESRDFLPGIRIPTEPELSKLCNVGRNTVREAVSSLVHEGLLKKIQGNGTFVTSESDSSYCRRGHQIGMACSFRNETLDVFDSIQDYVLNKDGLLALYNVSDDNQDLAREKKFLEKAEKEGFAGFIVLPSPNKPFNTELYNRLRNKGIKVALIAPYKDNMNDEVTFFYDYYHAGYVATAKMAMAGFKNVCLARVLLPVSYQWMKNGVKQASEDLGLELLDDFLFENKINHTENIKKLPPQTGIIATQTSVGNGIYDSIIESGVALTKDIALCAITEYSKPEYSGVSRLVSPQIELFKAAIDYIFNDEIKSTEIVHKKFKFKYEEHGTVEK